MKRPLILLLCVALSVAATYLLTTRHYRVGYFAENTIRDGIVQAKDEAKDGVKWARPLTVKGVTNLYQVSPALYRSGQPDRKGLAGLRNMGVKTVISLSDDDTEIAAGTGLELHHIPLSAMRRPTDKEVVEFLKIVSQPKNLPVLVHCARGADRTGTMCAIYRVAVQGWSKQDAIDEMTKGGFGYCSWFTELVKYIEKADFDRLKREAGMTTTAPAEALYK